MKMRDPCVSAHRIAVAGCVALLALLGPVATAEATSKKVRLSPGLASPAGKEAKSGAAGAARPFQTSACLLMTTACNSFVESVLTTDDCVLFDGSFYDIWGFEGRSGDTVQITMEAGFDTVLFLFDPNSNQVAFNDDFGGTTNSRITFTLTSTGMWGIFANAFDPDVTGAYSVDFLCTSTQPPPNTCVANATTLCLNSARFRVQVNWRVPTQGTSGAGTAVPLTSDTGYFWFFSSNNIELVLKVVDGRAFNGFFWVFYGALSDVEYTITVTDTVSGLVRSYTNTQGRLASVADVTAFPGSGSAGATGTNPGSRSLLEDLVRAKSREVASPLSSASPLVCASDATSLCLNAARFQVRVAWRVPTQGTSGVGMAVPLTSDTGYFWFFSSNNVELVIKVVDGRAFNGFFWVFYGALSDVEYTITVNDTTTAAVKTYTNPQGRLASVADVSAFQ